jgi:MoxR-like ATPase
MIQNETRDFASNPTPPSSITPSSNPAKQFYDAAVEQISKVFVGQQELVHTALVALFSGGHLLIEGVPGLGKTLFVRTLGRVLGCQFGRIQFTADLMPSDVTGAPIPLYYDFEPFEMPFNQVTGE